MKHARPLPPGMVQRYHGWMATTFAENKAWHAKLADEGQHPRTMVISCCDSRVHATSMFGAEAGDFFMHRNIANLVPPFAPNKDYHGTSAAVEYAVTALKVSNILVMGHTQCGGVAACHEMCTGNAPDLEESSSFVGRWMDILRPGHKRLEDRKTPEAEFVPALEREGILVSLENLMTFPFVAQRVHAEELSLHGVLIDIRSGELSCYDATAEAFRPV